MATVVSAGVRGAETRNPSSPGGLWGPREEKLGGLDFGVQREQDGGSVSRDCRAGGAEM